MTEMTQNLLAAFGASQGAISEITHREATGDRSVTLDRHDKAVLFRRYQNGSFARKGGATPNENPIHHPFLVNPHNSVTGPKLQSVNVVHPKRTGNELRLYEAGSGLTLQAGDFFYIFVRAGEHRPFIGTIDAKERNALERKSKRDATPTIAMVPVDDEEEDAAYQQAIGDVAAKLPGGFSGVRYPRDPKVALTAIKNAKFQCEAALDGEVHTTFTSASTGKPFVEAHHLLPLARQSSHDASLDVPENITALCPTCHRRLHHAAPDERLSILLHLFEKRAPLLKEKGLEISEADLLDAYGIGASAMLKFMRSSSGA